MIWERGTASCSKISGDGQKSTMLTRNRSMQSSSCKIEALLLTAFTACGSHQGFFCSSTQVSSKTNHKQSPAEHALQMRRKALLNSPALPWWSSISNLPYSSPYLRLWYIEFTKSCQLNFPKSLSHRVKLLLSHSFWLFYPRDKTSCEKKRREMKLQCGEKNRDYLGGSCGIQCVVWEQVINPISSAHIFIFTIFNACF